eukprot:TRINITY_DN108_c0_g1_i1.p1 TRINITY_DN108_c0_g1~~TRINITY_DN108_c0_g1_i1.p1  ORF type:complete len:283 (-),score=95.59 TRINITY_DN108_c0_g1_i1:93-941(-)
MTRPLTILATAFLALSSCCLAAVAQSTTTAKCAGLSITAERMAGKYFSEVKGGKYDSSVGFFQLTMANAGPNTYTYPNIFFNVTANSWYDLTGIPSYPYAVNIEMLTPSSLDSSSGYKQVAKAKTINTRPFTSPVDFQPGQTLTNFALAVRAGNDLSFAITDCTIVPQTTTTSASAVSSSTTGSPSGCSLSMTQTLSNSWNGGSQWTVTLNNAGSRPVSAVDILAAAPAQITQLWGMTSAGNGHYTLPTYTQAIAAGGSIQFGYTASTSASVGFSVSSSSCV